jgi:predicted RNA-binding protein
MNYWIFIVTNRQVENQTHHAREIFEQRVLDKYWGLGERTPNRNNLLQGDKVVFYLGNPEKIFAGAAILASNAYKPTPEDRIRLSHDNNPLYDFDYGVQLEEIKIWDTPRYVPNLVEDLSFIENKQYWGTYFQGGIRGISPEDFQTIQRYEFSDKKEHASEIESTREAQYFALEAHLEEFIFNNWQRVNWGRDLRLYRVEDSDGRQFPAGAWSIDFLAVDNRTNDFVVIELKRGRSSDNVVGQVLRYMGWVKINLCTEGQNAKGIIICHETDEALRFSVGQLPNVDVMLYEVDFRLNAI